MACPESLRTQSYFDGALEGDAASEAARHVESCADCTKLLHDLEAMHSAIRSHATYYHAEPALRARVRTRLDSAASSGAGWFALRARQFWTGVVSGGLATAAAAAVAFMLLLPSDADEVIADVSAAHARSLIGSHVIDVASSDPDVVKSWLKRRGQLAPPVGDFSREGYRLVGARADYVYEGGAGVAVYRHGNHIVNVFAWATDEDQDLPDSASSSGTNIVFWKKGNIVYCAVSNLAMNDLKSFSARLQQQA